MKKATKKVLQARDYSQIAREILMRLRNYPHPLLKCREATKIALIFVTSDRGLCGGFNSALLKELLSFIKETKEKNQQSFIITIGKKGRDFVIKFLKDKLLADFTGLNEEILYQEVTPINHLIIQDYLAKKYDQVFLLYTHFISSFVQRPTLVQLLPVQSNQVLTKQPVNQVEEYLLEPSSQEVLETLVPQFIGNQIYQAILESKASEHSARMIAMKNATENAEDLIDELYLTYHTARQATITSELIDITTAKRAMEE